MKKIDIFIILTILFQTLSIMVGKYASLRLGEFNIYNIATNYFYYISILFLFFQALTWQIVLKRNDLSHAYVFMNLVYIFILIFSRILFKEKVYISNILGALVILCGVVVCIKGAEENDV
jgi:drug/metabolite transporter (DMT)-like permease